MKVGDRVEILDRPHELKGDRALVPTGATAVVVELVGDSVKVQLDEGLHGWYSGEFLRPTERSMP